MRDQVSEEEGHSSHGSDSDQAAPFGASMPVKLGKDKYPKLVCLI